MQVRYTLSMPQPSTHYFEVKLDVSEISDAKLSLKMATWTPGSYLIREYAKNVERVEAKSESVKRLNLTKTNKNTWVLETGKAKKLEVTYRVYANELSVRNCYLDAEQGYLNPASVFLWVAGLEQQASTLKIELPKGWKEVVTALKPVGNDPTELRINSIDELIDSPILCGNPAIISFQAAGIEHRVAFQGEANWKADRIKADFARIIESQAKLFDHHPCSSYVFIVHHVAAGGGGLEHSHSTSLQTSPTTYDNESSYQNFLGLVSHEYFHLWNVKRLRPFALGPFNYDQENYTTLLWLAEGFTSYYDDLFLYRSGLIKRDRFLDIVGSNISRVESVPGMYNQSLSEASLDAWIKYYRPNENSSNSQSDYYTKGAAIATLLDWQIIKESKGEKSLDDLVKGMYQTYYLKKNRGFTEAEFEQELAQYLGKAKAKTFIANYIDGLEKPDWKKELAEFGIELKDRNDISQPKTLGLKLGMNGAKVTVQGIPNNGPAFVSGIHVGDELLAVGDRKIETADLNPLLAMIPLGQTVEVLYVRAGQIKSTLLKVERDPVKSFKLEIIEKASDAAARIREKWLKTDQ